MPAQCCRWAHTVDSNSQVGLYVVGAVLGASSGGAEFGASAADPFAEDGLAAVGEGREIWCKGKRRMRCRGALQGLLAQRASFRHGLPA